jgi:hypothetical protein
MAVTSEPFKQGMEFGCKNRSYKCLQILYEWYLQRGADNTLAQPTPNVVG